LLVVGVMVTLVVVLLYGSRFTIQSLGFSFLYGTTWNPNNNVYGILPFLDGTLITSAIALFLAVPLGLGAAIFLTQHAPGWLRGPVGQLIELLAAIPSIVYGFWGLIFFVPIERNYTEPFLKTWLGWTGLFGGTPFGVDFLTAGIILSIMAVPTITALSRDAIAAVPRAQKEAAISLGATDWEVTRRAVLPYARSGIVGGIVLGLGRALGETMAVVLTIGNTDKIGTSLFDSGETVSGGIALGFFEPTGPLNISALLEAGLVLLAITLAINLGARTILHRFQSGAAAGAE
ncbi:MAG TPA: phosphate ABC transporter permease subunit PstC, partial [Thermoplasmata archaeon]|nr:phosphate ABC transporter permease subunit PstC [Thermoplasmata archaeon]